MSRSDVARLSETHAAVFDALARPRVGTKFHEMLSVWFRIIGSTVVEWADRLDAALKGEKP